MYCKTTIAPNGKTTVDDGELAGGATVGIILFMISLTLVIVLVMLAREHKNKKRKPSLDVNIKT